MNRRPSFSILSLHEQFRICIYHIDTNTRTLHTQTQKYTRTHRLGLGGFSVLFLSPISPPAERRQKLFDGTNFPESGPGAGALGQVPNSEGCAGECRTGACVGRVGRRGRACVLWRW